jgi:hypothetical protein
LNIRQLHGDDSRVVSRSRAHDHWRAWFHRDRSSPRSHPWDRKQRRCELLLIARPKLDDCMLAPMMPIGIKSRHGLSFHAHLTRPLVAPP